MATEDRVADLKEDLMRFVLLSMIVRLADTKLTRLFRSGTLSDFDIVCGGKTYKVHKVMLYSQSKYFGKVFSGNFKVDARQYSDQLLPSITRLHNRLVITPS